MYKGKWRISIKEEDWEYKDRKEMEANIKILLDMKEKYGQLKER